MTDQDVGSISYLII